MSQVISAIPLKVPCYLVKANAGYFLIDTGDSSDRANLERALDQAGVNPGSLKLILLTHGDFDHVGNAAFLREKYGAKIAMHAGDTEMVKRGDDGQGRKPRPDRITAFGKFIMFLSRYLIKPGRLHTFEPDIFVEDGSSLLEYGFDAKVLHLPGHSRGSIGILTGDGSLFCGDLLMNMVKPELHFMIDDLPACRSSIERLKKLNISRIYPGHGKPFSRIP